MSSKDPITTTLPLSEPQLAAITTACSQHHVARLYLLARCCGRITALARATSIYWLNSSRSNPLSWSTLTSDLRNSSPTALAPWWIW